MVVVQAITGSEDCWLNGKCRKATIQNLKSGKKLMKTHDEEYHETGRASLMHLLIKSLNKYLLSTNYDKALF